MVITILEAHVAADKSEALERAYKEGIMELEPGILQTFLLYGVADASLWRIVTVWRSREALDAMRQSGQTPRGVLMFRAAEAEPTLSISNVAAHTAAAA